MERTVESMSTLKAIVSGGRAIIEDVGDYPDGTELELEVVANDEMSADELLRLNASIDRGIAECKAGLAVPAEVVLEEMRSRSR